MAVFGSGDVAQLFAFTDHYHGIVVKAVVGFGNQIQVITDLKEFPNFQDIIILKSCDKTVE